MMIRWAMVAGVLVAICGCGSGAGKVVVVPVSGSVKYKGQPVDGALVSFATTASPRTAVGMTDAQGNFKLTTMNTDDGAVAGEHVVTISKAAKADGNVPKMQSPEDYAKYMQQTGSTKPPGAEVSKGMIPEKYSNPATSGLKRTVVAGESNVFNFDLE
jgi:hypothetical protein